MKKTIKRILASLLCVCFCIAFSITAGAADALSDILASLDTVEKYDIIEYDYVTGNEQVISWESIPDYSKTVSSTFSLSNPATKAPEFHSYELSDSLPVLNQPVRTYLNGDPYSGVVYLALGVDTERTNQSLRQGYRVFGSAQRRRNSRSQYFEQGYFHWHHRRGSRLL